MKVLYIASTGTGDPTRASIPFHLAANGSAAIGQQVSIVLAGDAAELIVGDAASQVTGLGLPSLTELLNKVVEHQLPVYV
ncbi:MAG: DsrE family protein [Actinomycetota bacterium]